MPLETHEEYTPQDIFPHLLEVFSVVDYVTHTKENKAQRTYNRNPSTDTESRTPIVQSKTMPKVD